MHTMQQPQLTALGWSDNIPATQDPSYTLLASFQALDCVQAHKNLGNEANILPDITQLLNFSLNSYIPWVIRSSSL